jgi:hypothetical protein
MKYRAKVNARKKVCGGINKNGKQCGYQYDTKKGWACKKHMKTIPMPPNFTPPEKRELTLNKPKKIKPQKKIDSITVTLANGVTLPPFHLEDIPIQSKSEALVVWKKVVSAKLNSLVRCEKNIQETFFLSLMIKHIDAELDKRGFKQ